MNAFNELTLTNGYKDKYYVYFITFLKSQWQGGMGRLCLLRASPEMGPCQPSVEGGGEDDGEETGRSALPTPRSQPSSGGEGADKGRGRCSASCVSHVRHSPSPSTRRLVGTMKCPGTRTVLTTRH